MAIAQRASYPTASGSSQSPAVTKPTGTSAGDLIVAVLGLADNSGTVVTPPNEGWTRLLQLDSEIPGGMTLSIWWRYAGASEGATWTFSTLLGFAADNNWATVGLAFYDDAAAKKAYPYGAATREEPAGDSNHATASITTLSNNDIVISAFLQDQTGSDGAWAVAAPGTEIAEQWTPLGNAGLEVQAETRAAAGAGAHNATQTTGGDNTRGSATGIFAVGLTDSPWAVISPDFYAFPKPRP